MCDYDEQIIKAPIHQPAMYYLKKLIVYISKASSSPLYPSNEPPPTYPGSAFALRTSPGSRVAYIIYFIISNLFEL